MFADVLRGGSPSGFETEVGVLVVAEAELGSGQVDVVVRAPFGRENGRWMPCRRPFHGRRAVAQFDGDREVVDADRRRPEGRAEVDALGDPVSSSARLIEVIPRGIGLARTAGD